MIQPAPTRKQIELERMHATYREGGAKLAMAPHVIYADASCPHPDCAQHLQAIDFRLKAFGRAVQDALVKAWWDDTGFAGRCPTCNRWIHFTIRGRQPIDDATAATLPQLPANWASAAVIL